MAYFWIEERTISPTLLSLSSSQNKIHIVELESKEEFADFDGVKLNNRSRIFYFFKLYSCLINYLPRVERRLDSRERDYKCKTPSFCSPQLE